MLAGLWWVSAQPGALAAPASSCYDENDTCERSLGENCSNCPQDCDCICGDDLCTETGPEYETCSSCVEDCWDECVCGDSICATPAEYGGYGSFNEPECNPSDPEAECSFCATDCGACETDDCDPYVCQDEYGQCRWCQQHSECAYGDQYCEWYGQCEVGASCDPYAWPSECDTGWTCSFQFEVCVPNA